MHRSTILSSLLAACLLLVASCGETSAPDGVVAQRYERLDLDVVAGSPPVGEERVLHRFDLPTDSGEWDVDSPARRFAKLPGTETRTLLVRAGPDEGQITLERDGEFDLSTFDTVRLTYTFAGIGWVSVAFFADGQLVHRAPSVFFERNETPVPLVVPLELAGKTGVCDRVQLVIGSKSHRVVRLVTVEMVDAPLGRMLPSPDGPPVAHSLANQSRLAQRLVSDRPLETMIDVGSEAELRFSFGRNTAPGGDRDDASMLVTLLDLDGTPVTQKRFAAPLETKTWTPGALDLSDHAGEILTLRFALDGPPQAWVLGEVALWGPPDDSLPNVLLITSDTHRADHVGLAPDAVDVRTPAIDELARRGVMFLDVTSPSNVTNPSHISIMTGVNPRDTGIVVNRVPLAERATTVAEVFAEAGYVTLASVGTAHIGHDGSGLGQGFDRMDWPPKVPRDAVEIIDIAEEWLDEIDGQSVFLWVHVFDAHWPYEPPEGYDRRDYDGPADPFDPSLPPLDVPDEKLPHDMQGLRVLEYPRAQYRSEISYLDDQLDRLFEMEPLRDAIVALTSDHGEGLGESLVWFEHAELYPGSLWVPLMLSWPGGPTGVRIAAPVSNIDLGHTLAALAGVEASALPGRDLTELVELDDDSEPLRFFVSSGAQSASLQDGDDYLVLALTAHEAPTSERAFELHQVELYDLASDPDCVDDLVEREFEKAREMRARLVAWLLDGAPGDLRGQANESPEFLAQLQALGYVDNEVEEASSFWEEDDCEWCRRMRR